MKTYSLIFMSFDGDIVTDKTSENIDELIYEWENIGSKWFFYPFGFITSGEKIKISGDGLIRMRDKKSYSDLMFTGRELKTIQKVFKDTFDFCEKNEIENLDCFEYENLIIELNKKLIRN
jgi:hypothetical protein